MTLDVLFGLYGQKAPAVEVHGITHDSRRIQPGFVFVAFKGKCFDGHQYIGEAIRRGAVGIVGEQIPDDIETPHLTVADTRAALSRLAATFHGHPSRNLYVIGVTGTKGKTTTSHLIHHLLEANGHPTGLLSTVGVWHRRDGIEPSGHMTTPAAPEVQSTLAEMVRRGEEVAVLETSSHALLQKRVADVEYQLAVWTHLEPEHLELHGDVESYFRTKATLIERSPLAVLNQDDPYARRLMDHPHVAYGTNGGEFRCSRVRQSHDGVHFELHAPGWTGPAHLPGIGTYNVENALAAIAAVAQLDVEPAEAAPALQSFAGVPGRMQVVVQQPIRGIVDFAHTPNSLTRAIDAARMTAIGRLILVFGGIGERDPRKRAPMGRIAMEKSDFVIVTEDDWNDEDPLGILAEVERGVRRAGGVRGEDYIVVPDRSEAIHAAARLAHRGDTVLVTGKGHERSITRGRRKTSWSDVNELRDALAGGA